MDFVRLISKIKLRIKSPDTHRPFKIPLNVGWLCVLLLLPATVYFAALGGAFSSTEKAVVPAAFAIIALLSTELVWWIIKWGRSVRVD